MRRTSSQAAQCENNTFQQIFSAHLPRRSFVWLLWLYLESLILSGQTELEKLKRISFARDA